MLMLYLIKNTHTKKQFVNILNVHNVHTTMSMQVLDLNNTVYQKVL